MRKSPLDGRVHRRQNRQHSLPDETQRMDRTARTFLARLLDMAAAAGSAATAAITAAAVSLAATKTPAVSWLAGSDLR